MIRTVKSLKVRFIQQSQTRAYRRYGISLSPKKDLKPLLTLGKRSRKYGWLKQYDSIALPQAIINLDTAFLTRNLKRVTHNLSAATASSRVTIALV